jgi:hypothetical protein
MATTRAKLGTSAEHRLHHPYTFHSSKISAVRPIVKRTLVTLCCVLLLSGFSFAQAADLAVLAGGIFTTDKSPSAGVGTCTTSNPFCGQTVHTPTKLSFEGALAVRVANAHIASLHLELPVVGTPTRTLEQGGFRQDFSTVFFTPGLRLRASLPFFSPFVAVGGGFAHYAPSTSGTSTTASSTVAAFQVGGGFDLSSHIPLIAFRVEARAFHTGTPSFTVGQNQVFAGAGLVLRF